MFVKGQVLRIHELNGHVRSPRPYIGLRRAYLAVPRSQRFIDVSKRSLFGCLTYWLNEYK
jgi:hypothetical protein